MYHGYLMTIIDYFKILLITGRVFYLIVHDGLRLLKSMLIGLPHMCTSRDFSYWIQYESLFTIAGDLTSNSLLVVPRDNCADMASLSGIIRKRSRKSKRDTDRASVSVPPTPHSKSPVTPSTDNKSFHPAVSVQATPSVSHCSTPTATQTPRSNLVPLPRRKSRRRQAAFVTGPDGLSYSLNTTSLLATKSSVEEYLPSKGQDIAGVHKQTISCPSPELSHANDFTGHISYRKKQSNLYENWMKTLKAIAPLYMCLLQRTVYLRNDPVYTPADCGCGRKQALFVCCVSFQSE